jgi:spore coat polysaccharide biosynthesis protein SpsF
MSPFVSSLNLVSEIDLIVAIVQARMGSSRLPGKILRDLNGRLVLAHVLTRARAVPGIDQVCCAIPDDPANDVVATIAAKLGAVICRGPEADVLKRYLTAARATNAQVVMRVTSDCPLLDPVVSSQVLDDFLTGGADYVSNVDPPSWPKGLDTEVFSRDALELAADRATDAYDREHVTPWLQRAPGVVRRNVALAGGDFGKWRWTLDYEEDLTFMQAVLARMKPLSNLPGFEEIRSVVEMHPEIAAINASLR